MSKWKPPVHRCIRCGRYRFDNETWETAIGRSGGSSYMDEIESTCHRCVPKVMELIQPHLDEKRAVLEAEAKRIIRLKRSVDDVRTGRIPSAPLTLPETPPEIKLMKARSEEKCTTCTYPAVDQIWESLPFPSDDDFEGHRCVIAEIHKEHDTVRFRWLEGGGEFGYSLMSWFRKYFKYVGEKEPEEDDILRKLW